MKNNIPVALKRSEILSDLDLEKEEYNLLTLHRHYNVDNTTVLETILKQLGRLGEKIVFPVHPRTRKMIAPSFTFPANIQAVEPQGYLDFIVMENFAKRIITDSGGIQKEAYILGKPCITLRTETEWVETVEEKWNLLIDPLDSSMVLKIKSFQVPAAQNELFGTDVTAKMVKIINSFN